MYSGKRTQRNGGVVIPHVCLRAPPQPRAQCIMHMVRLTMQPLPCCRMYWQVGTILPAVQSQIIWRCSACMRVHRPYGICMVPLAGSSMPLPA